MKKLLILISVIFLSCNQVNAMDSRLRVMGTMAGYGVVGGALLGTASLAFGTSGRAIAKGASLGLYAGLIFGAYAITSYELKKRGYGEPKEDYYPDSNSPYEEQSYLINLNHSNIIALNDKIQNPFENKLIEMNFLNFQF